MGGPLPAHSINRPHHLPPAALRVTARPPVRLPGGPGRRPNPWITL